MKSKIFVCGNSEIGYINTNKSIQPIPVILSFSNEEEYNDFYDITADAFYNRILYDKKAKVTLKYQNYAAFCEYIEKAIADGYEQVLFILGNKAYGDIFVPAMLVKSQYNNIPIYIYSSNALSYPLANMALEANKMFEDNKSIDTVLARLEEMDKEYALYFYSPKTDIRYVYPKNFLLSPKMIMPSKRIAYKFDGELSDFFPTSMKHVLLSVYKELLSNAKGKKLFLLYTNKNSELYKVCKEFILNRNPGIKEIEEYPIPPALGIKLGINTIGAGLITVEK